MRRATERTGNLLSQPPTKPLPPPEALNETQEINILESEGVSDSEECSYEEFIPDALMDILTTLAKEWVEEHAESVFRLAVADAIRKEKKKEDRRKKLAEKEEPPSKKRKLNKK